MFACQFLPIHFIPFCLVHQLLSPTLPSLSPPPPPSKLLLQTSHATFGPPFATFNYNSGVLFLRYCCLYIHFFIMTMHNVKKDNNFLLFRCVALSLSSIRQWLSPSVSFFISANLLIFAFCVCVNVCVCGVHTQCTVEALLLSHHRGLCPRLKINGTTLQWNFHFFKLGRERARAQFLPPPRIRGNDS